MKRPDGAVRETGSGEKSGYSEQNQLSVEGRQGKTLKNIHTTPHECWLIQVAALDLFAGWC